MMNLSAPLALNAASAPPALWGWRAGLEERYHGIYEAAQSAVAPGLALRAPGDGRGAARFAMGGAQPVEVALVLVAILWLAMLLSGTRGLVRS